MQRGAGDHRGRRGPLSRLSMAVGVAGATLGLFDCSLILDWSDYTSASGGIDWDVLVGDEGVADSDAKGGEPDSGGGSPSLAGLFRGPRCLPAAPPGWTGPLALNIDSSGSQPLCEPHYPVQVFDGSGGLNFSPASCSACTCGSPQGGSCIPPSLTAYSDFLCRTQCGSPVAVTDMQCSSPPSCSFQSFQVSAAGVDAGTCAPTSVTPTKDQATWSYRARLCAPSVPPPSGSCKSDELLVPLPPPPSLPRLCIMSSGKVPCPNDIYSQSNTFYSTDAVDDTRACSDCTCAATGSSCSIQSPPAAGAVYDSMCRPQLGVSFTIPSVCVTLVPGVQPPSNFKLNQSLMLNPGSCAPSGGGQSTGTVTPTGTATTVCCTP